MPPWLHWLGYAAVALVGLGTLGFALTAVLEHEWRACGVSLALGAAATGALGLPLWVAFPGRPWVLLALLGAGSLVALVALLPAAGTSRVCVVGEQPRVDERDAVFHRFYRLQPGTPEHEAYYAQRPELLTLDERIRALPQIGTPGAPGYHPLTAPYAAAAFDLIEEMASFAERAPAPLQETPPAPDPAELTRRLKGYARYQGAVAVGCARVNPAYVYSHNARGPGPWGEPIALDHPNVLVLAVEMRHGLIRHAPAPPTLTESATRYLDSARIALLLAQVLRRLGYRARAHVDGNYRVMVVPLAVDAGLGELGRIGLLMTPQYGPRVRLAAVTTDAPLVPDAPRSFGAAAFCEICRKCADVCPSHSIPKGPREVVAGVDKWQSRRDTCYRYWRQVGTDCALCLKVCPFSHPGGAVHQVVRWAIRRGALARRLALWGDDLCYGRRPTSGGPLPEWHEQS